MGFASKAKTKGTGGENWGMGLLLVFFPDENNDPTVEKSELFSSSPASAQSPIRRSNSNPIISKAQSTISMCFLLVCITFLLFTLSTFEPTSSPFTEHRAKPSRRLMAEKFSGKYEAKSKYRPDSPISSSWLRNKWRGRSNFEPKSVSPYPIALQGMGALYRRGTRAMNDLIVGHLVEDIADGDLRLFLRLLHRSGLTARADLVLVFDSPASATRFGSVIEEENDSFLRLVDHYREINGSKPAPAANFDVTQFVKSGKAEKEPGEPLWGKKTRSNSNYSGPGGEEGYTESTRLSYGSVVGFDVTELDPENSLSGFLNHVPMSLRRWACYPMLLGRVRRNFKHTMLVDVKNLVVVGDPLGRVRNRPPHSVYLSAKTESNKHGKRNSEKTQSHRTFNSGIIMGGIRGLRRLSSAMQTDIARAAMHNKKNSVSESVVLSQLAGNEIIMKTQSINLVTSSEAIPEASWLSNSGSHSGVSVIQRGNNSYHELSEILMKKICTYEVDFSVYRDC